MVHCKEPNTKTFTESYLNKEVEKDSLFLKKRELDFPISLFSFLQANNTGLYISSRAQVDDTVLFKIIGDITNQPRGVLQSGRGPNEMEFLTSSSKSITGDSLFFFSHANYKFLMIDEAGEANDLSFSNSEFSAMEYSFAVNKNYIAFPVNIRFGKKDLITIYNKDSHEVSTAIRVRVPIGFQPAIRNQVSAICPVPGGFAISFIGDKKIYLINFEGEVFQELILGESDKIEPEQNSRHNLSSSGKPYLVKMEFRKGRFFVLLEGDIWVIDYGTKNVSKIVRVFDKGNVATKPTDFSIADSTMFVRLGRNGIAQVELTKFIDGS